MVPQKRNDPRGNTDGGRDISHPQEHGIMAPSSGIGAGNYTEMRTLSGSGPDTWSHDWTAAGIRDLVGNVWDMVSGLRIVDGELQIIADNDSALNVDESPSSPLWRAIDTSGNLVAPGSPNTYKYDGISPGISDEGANLVPGGVRLSTTVSNFQYTGSHKPGDDFYAWTMMPFKDMEADAAPHVLLIELGLYPAAGLTGGDNFFIRNYGERMPIRGGSWLDGHTAGIWELYLRDDRHWIFPDVGFRAAYVDLKRLTGLCVRGRRLRRPNFNAGGHGSGAPHTLIGRAAVKSSGGICVAHVLSGQQSDAADLAVRRVLVLRAIST
jgi:hypothetical protein